MPGWQTPLESQQPVGHELALQLPQVWLVGSQVLPAGQSVELLQPQAPPARQTCPTAACVQSMQVPPDGPHAVLAVPAAQLPWLQQPPPQVPLPAAPQAAVQAPEVQVG